jgi:hypothetical protein
MQSNRSSIADAIPKRRMRAARFWLSAVALEGASVSLGVFVLPDSGRGWWTAVIICHLAAAAVLLAMGMGTPGEAASKAHYRARLYGFLVMFLPVMGLVGSLILQLVCDRWIRARGLVEDFQAETEHRVIETQRPEIQMDLKTYFDEELAVQPVMDILAGFDDNLKRGAIDTLRRIGTPEAVNILKKCLADASPEVRYNAHTALTRLDEAHVRAIKTAKQPLDAGNLKAEHHRHYARQCADYGQSGLLDDDTRRYYLQMAKDAFMAAQAAGLSDTALTLDLGRLEMLLGAYGQAAAHFQSVLTREPANVNALIGLAEVHYTRGDAEGLKAIAHQMSTALTVAVGSVNEGILLHFWASPQKAI